ncbi:GNAT family N-acetyltransferase [Siphonobacter sp. BAB-5385]|uniref:GNAT family N-acetyltransferase n=1 Tax=Siphonobacter sp. BAB-5385 TaxID=1864822 RepID=UPI000B9EE43F|nr:GNAT family N-acetyltransferase [Siphonobacter sp. BAB-5385]OZI07896.1 GNAT family N-acetyltransferase [Siphonobacter sp. BAB-5385]
MLHKALLTFPTLTTKQLTLRQLVESDGQAIFLLRSEPTLNKYLDRKLSQTLEEALHFIRNIQTRQFLYWAIVDTVSGKLLGTISLFYFSDEMNTCGIGYELLTDYQGRGIMQEAAKKIIAFAFDRLGIETIEAFTHKDNQRSTRLLQKLTFEKTEFTDANNPDVIVFRLFNHRAA